MPPRQIIAIGGGGFSAGSEGLAIDRYILAQARKPEPAVAFLATASGDAAFLHRSVLQRVRWVALSALSPQLL